MGRGDAQGPDELILTIDDSGTTLLLGGCVCLRRL
jgi:hypothetical protein